MTVKTEGGTTIRWLPRQGRPVRSIEWVSQTIIKVIAFLPIYVAIIVTILLLLQIYVISVFL